MTEQTKMRGMASRKIAVDILVKVEQSDAYANQALATAFNKHSLPERDRAFVTYIVQGTLRHQSELDDELSKFSKKPVAKLSPSLRAVLRSALFQMNHMEDMPPSAVINTAVEIARKTGHEGQSKFVNGVLRSYLRSKEGTREAEAGGTPALPGSEPSVCETSQGSDSESTQEPLPGSTLRPLPIANCDVAPAVLTGFQPASIQQDQPGSRPGSAGVLPASISRDPAKLAKKYSLPEWIVTRWMERFEQDEYLRLFEDSQKIPLLTLRVAAESISTEGLMSIFQKKGMLVEKSKLLPTCINVLDRGGFGGPVSKLPGYEEGLFSVQDEPSALVSIILAPQPGQTIVDLCAAPGGKSIHLGELMQNKGRVIAVDSNAKRLSLLGSERRRLGLQNIETVVMDGRELKLEQPCDAVLIDAPCSGTGVLNRRSDLRQHRKESDLASLIKVQEDLLENAAQMLKPGGVFVYSTCSIEPEENEQNLQSFLAKHSEFKPDNLEPYFNQEILEQWKTEKHWPETSKQLTNGYIQLLPSRHGCSGFFICRLKREVS